MTSPKATPSLRKLKSKIYGSGELSNDGPEMELALKAYEAGKLEVLEQLMSYKNEQCECPRWHEFRITSEGVTLLSVGDINEMSVEGWAGNCSAVEAISRLDING